MAFMRKSKFRHVFGKALKREQCYDALRISRSSWDAKFCAVNPKFVAVITESGGGGAFVVIPLAKVGRQDINAPQVAGHKGAVYDIAWCPHNDNVIASCSEDCSTKIWMIPDDGLTEPMLEPVVDLVAHKKRVTSLSWHPTAKNILLTTGSDFLIMSWNVGTGDALMELTMPDQIYSMAYNENGSLFACTCKDKKLRVVDSHTGEIMQEIEAHNGSKPQQCVFLKDNKVLTTGHSKTSERQVGLWDAANNLSMMAKEDIDTSNGVMFIFYDPDTGMIYLAGKGDSQIRYFEVTDEKPYVHFLSMYSTSSPQKGVGYMPKRGLNVMQNEIARIYKLHNNGLCEVTPFTVPRKSELFQDDLYPDTASDVPAITAEEFFSGKNASPLLISLKSQDTSVKKEPLKFVKKSNILDQAPKPSSSLGAATSTPASSNGAEAAATTMVAAALPPKSSAADVSELKKEIGELRKIISEQNTRMETLEKRVCQLEEANHTDEEVEEGDEEA